MINSMPGYFKYSKALAENRNRIALYKRMLKGASGTALRAPYAASSGLLEVRYSAGMIKVMVCNKDTSQLYPEVLQGFHNGRCFARVYDKTLMPSNNQPDVVVAEGADWRYSQVMHQSKPRIKPREANPCR